MTVANLGLEYTGGWKCYFVVFGILIFPTLEQLFQKKYLAQKVKTFRLSFILG